MAIKSSQLALTRSGGSSPDGMRDAFRVPENRLDEIEAAFRGAPARTHGAASHDHDGYAIILRRWIGDSMMHQTIRTISRALRSLTAPRAALSLVAAVILIGLMAPRASAATDQAAMQPYIQQLGAEVTAIIKEQHLGMYERQAKFRVLFKQYFDARKIGRFVLGRTWKDLTEAQREEYKYLFYNYIAAVYAVVFSRYNQAVFTTTDVQPIGPDDGTVNAEVAQPGKPSLKVAFKVHGVPEGLKIEDVFVENVSLIISMRKEFGEVLEREGIDGVLKRLKGLVMPLNQPLTGK
jgi:phospholipid transport system substrate-binding protein